MFYLLYTYPNQTRVHVMHDVNDKVIVAEPGHEHLLREIAESFRAHGIIGTAQIVESVGDAFSMIIPSKG